MITTTQKNSTSKSMMSSIMIISKYVTLFASLLVFCFVANAQNNTSYNINSIPVTGANNCAIGVNTLSSNISGDNNAALGYQALFNNTSGESNTAIGSASLKVNTSGKFNTATGYGTLGNNTFGQYNTASGYISLIGNVQGYFNAGIGCYSLVSNTSGSGNIGMGSLSLYNNTTGSYNTGLGFYANVGSGNLTNATAIGANSIVTASNTIQLGDANVTDVYAGTGTTAKLIAGKLQITGGSPFAGKVLTSDNQGNATWQFPSGSGGASWNLTGNAGTVDGTDFVGTTDDVPLNFRVNNRNAGRLDPKFFNSFYGIEAGNSNISGNDNTANGYQALYFNTTGFRNSSVGNYSLYYNTMGSNNTAFGYLSLYSNNSGGYNTAVGVHAMDANISGYYNTAGGFGALANNATGHYNTSTGTGALLTNVSGDYNTALGSSADVSVSNLTNATAIGNGAIVNASYKVVIGDNTPGIVIGGYANWSNYSDGRFKENINENVPGLEFITKLRPVTYTINTKKLDEHIMQNMPDSVKAKRMQKQEAYAEAATKIQTGFIAQEVEKTAKEIGYNFDGVNAPKNPTDNYSIAYSQFVVPLVKAVQELSKQNNELKKELDELKELVKTNSNKYTEGSLKINESSDGNARLFQNMPNPFSKSTIIKYIIPSNAKRAIITISSVNGVNMKTFDLKSNSQSVEITGGQLTAGTYIYSLFVDGILIDSKQMILTN